MIISDLSYLEIVSEVPSLVGGVRIRTNDVTVKAKVKTTTTGSDNSITTSQSISVVSSNDDL